MLRLLISYCLPVITLLLLAGESVADLELGSPFGDHMVLQHDQPVKIWGWAEPGESVTVTLKEQSASATAADDGKWNLQLPAPGVGDPFSVKVAGKSQVIELTDVVGGEVWICGGQSNMVWDVRRSKNAKVEIAAADYPMIRLVEIARVTSLAPKDKTKPCQWLVCSPETVGDFTAVGYFFARRLHRDLKVPVGLVSSNWGGSIIEAWISGNALKGHPDFKAAVEKLEAVSNEPDKAETMMKKFKAWQKAFGQIRNTPAETWQDVATDDSTWGTQKLPGCWEKQGFKNVDGVAWYRRKVSIADSWKGKALKLSLGKIDDADVTWVNGVRVGGNKNRLAKRKYNVPAGLTNSNELSIAVKVVDGRREGGIVGDAEELSIGPVGEAPISLAGQWKFKLEPATEKLGPRPKRVVIQNRPTVLYNSMINPLAPFAARGTIWYQGESNAKRGRQYRALMPLLINDWRNLWGNEMPFYWVQLANFTAATKDPGDSQWAELREAQTMTLSLPKTGQAVIVDIGEAKNIHPKNKQDVGKRLALIALAKDYGKDVKYSGPMYKSMSVEGEKIRIQFDFAGGLAAKDGGELKRFEISGEDRKFYWADATIDGQSIVVSSSEIESPVAVRYAWADNPEGCNLTNETGLPASPFRTDDWQREEKMGAIGH